MGRLFFVLWRFPDASHRASGRCTARTAPSATAALEAIRRRPRPSGTSTRRPVHARGGRARSRSGSPRTGRRFGFGLWAVRPRRRRSSAFAGLCHPHGSRRTRTRSRSAGAWTRRPGATATPPRRGRAALGPRSPTWSSSTCPRSSTRATTPRAVARLGMRRTGVADPSGAGDADGSGRRRRAVTTALRAVADRSSRVLPDGDELGLAGHRHLVAALGELGARRPGAPRRSSRARPCSCWPCRPWRS